jgi:hypothetical protein
VAAGHIGRARGAHSVVSRANSIFRLTDRQANYLLLDIQSGKLLLQLTKYQVSYQTDKVPPVIYVYIMQRKFILKKENSNN